MTSTSRLRPAAFFERISPSRDRTRQSISNIVIVSEFFCTSPQLGGRSLASALPRRRSEQSKHSLQTRREASLQVSLFRAVPLAHKTQRSPGSQRAGLVSGTLLRLLGYQAGSQFPRVLRAMVVILANRRKATVYLLQQQQEE